ncbi:MAG: type II toxin-antitoxin system VapB family antitoxin [Gallionella sp.]
MATHLVLDPLLLQEALTLGGFKSKKEAVNQALREFVQRRKQREIIDLFGYLPADPDYDYKKSRQ